MMTPHIRIRRHLRSVRVSVLTAEERRDELRAAEHLAHQDDRPTPGTGRARDATPSSRGIP